MTETMTRLATDIATAAASPLGTSVSVVGVVNAVRQLGKLTFFKVQDCFSEIQAVATGSAQLVIKNHDYPFYASVSGTLKQRPFADRRPNSLNGTVEIETDALTVHRQIGSRVHNANSSELFIFLIFLQSRGFLDVKTLAGALAPSNLDLLTSDDPRPLRHLTYLLGPCRWYFLAGGNLHFGLTPGFTADLQGLLRAELDACPTAHRFRERAVWRQGYADAPANLLPMAYGVIENYCIHEDMSSFASSAYWRDTLSIIHLSDRILADAARPRIDGVAAQTLEERLARGQALLQDGLGPLGHSDGSVVLEDVPRFDLHGHHIKQLTDLFPSLRGHLAHSDVEHQVDVIWSLLGHDHVKEICSSQRATELLTKCVRSNLFTDYSVLRCVDMAALESLVTLTHDFTCQPSMRVVEQLFRRTPGAASSALYLMARIDRLGLDWKRCADVATRGIISDLVFIAAALGVCSTEDIVSWRDAITLKLGKLYTNEPLDETFCLSTLNHSIARSPWLGRALEARGCDDIVFDLVNLTYGNGLLSYEEAYRLFSRAVDCSDHWELAGIKFGGERWNGIEQRLNLTGLDLYPSKNRAAILAKSCSGICSARDFALFHRKDHFQFTLVRPSTATAVGTVQMYSCQDEKNNGIWVVRGLNPSDKISVDPVGFTFDILDTLASLARHNEISALVFADGAGLFNADSGRIQLRTVTRRLSSAGKKVTFGEPLHLFDYHDRPIRVEFGWQIWP